MYEERESIDQFKQENKNLSQYVEEVIEIFETWTEKIPQGHEISMIKNWIEKFGVIEVMKATETSFRQYYDADAASWQKTFDYIPRICYTRQKQQSDPQAYYQNYACKVLEAKGITTLKESIRAFIRERVLTDEDFKRLKTIINSSENLSDFQIGCINEFGDDPIKEQENGQ
jgi:hypothetical protein